jgi:hypothetical protein
MSPYPAGDDSRPPGFENLETITDLFSVPERYPTLYSCTNGILPLSSLWISKNVLTCVAYFAVFGNAPVGRFGCPPISINCLGRSVQSDNCAGNFLVWSNLFACEYF